MPQFLVLVMILATVIGEGLAKSGILPRGLAYLPELLSGVAALYVIALGPRTGFRFVRGIYWVLFGAMTLHVVSGIVIGNVGPGSIVTGLRYFLRALPFFLLPAIYAFSDRQVNWQLWLLTLLCLLQIPMVLYQRTIPGTTGDGISGTMSLTSNLSPFLVCAACLLTAFFVRRQLRLTLYALLLMLLLLPTALNETKVTLILLPLGLLATVLFSSTPGTRARNLMLAVGCSGALLAAFASVYAYTQRDVEGGITNLQEFFFEGGVEEYLDTDKGLGDVTDDENQAIGRANALLVPLQYIAKDPITLWFGLGLGNASVSFLGEQYSGKYGELFGAFMGTAATRLLLETGIGGLTCALLLMFLLFQDSRELAAVGEGAELRSGIGSGWCAVILVMTIVIFYADPIVSVSLSYTFCYLSGLIASDRMRLVAAQPVYQRPGARAISPVQRAM